MKKKIVALSLVVCLLAIAIVGGTLAYFTDTDEVTNTFTAGQVGIFLDEAVVKLDDNPNSATFGDLVAVGSGQRTQTGDIQNYHLFPAMTVTKDPTITVDAGSEDAFIGAKITITGDIYDLIGVENAPNIDITKLASGGLIAETATQVNGWNGLPMVYETNTCVIYQDASQAANNTWVLYIFIKAPMAEKEKVALFTTLYIPENWDNAEMALINGMNIYVEAFATQTNGFVDVYTAQTTAFPTAYDFN